MGPIVHGAVNILFALQATQASVAGAVRDQDTGDPLAGATVVLTDLARATTTDAEGRYRLPGVPAGPQHVTVRFIGYASRTLHALVPQSGQLDITVTLRRIPFRMPEVRVRPPVAMRGAESGDSTAYPDRGSTMAAVANHPMLSEPDAFQALGGGAVVLRPEAPSGVHIRGGGSDQTAYLLDDVPVLSPYHVAGVFSAWNPDALSKLSLSSATPSVAQPDALSGSVAGVTRSPGEHFAAQGSISTTQLRLTVDGPLGVAGAGYLVSLRSGFPSMTAPRNESAYIRGETGDALAKLVVPALGGHLGLLLYESENEVNTAAATRNDDSAAASTARNLFEWRSRSLGAEWRRRMASVTVRLLGWSATGRARSHWDARTGSLSMAAGRHDDGIAVSAEHAAGGGTTVVGLRFERNGTSYRVTPDSATEAPWILGASTPVAALFGQHARRLGRKMELDVAASLTGVGGDVYLAPRTRLQWNASPRLTLSGSVARTQQFAQSMRNAESVVGSVFPADLYLGAGVRGVPVARSTQGVVAAEYRPSPGVRLGIEAYARDLGGLLLVAPRDGGPFASSTFARGSGTARGFALDAAVSAARYGVMASYGYQRVRLAYGDSSYVPDHGAPHLVEAGIIVFPTPTWSLRVGATGAMGRRATTIAGGLEWESCNLLDEGCEFGGSPHHGGESLGASALPAYFRMDVGLRKHWHFTVGGHDLPIALFGTVTNVFSRTNVLRYARNPETGELVAVEMRPLAPLVVGLDWRY